MNIKKAIITFFTGIILLANYSFYIPQQTIGQEYALKAAFVYRFCDYVEWGNNNSSEFNIAVLGESAITEPLSELAKAKNIKNKKVTIAEYKHVDDMPEYQGGVGFYQIIFVSRNYAFGIENVIAKVGDLPVLIISEQDGAIEKGSVINFSISNNKLKFDINMKAVSRAGLKISSQLLQHAQFIKS